MSRQFGTPKLIERHLTIPRMTTRRELFKTTNHLFAPIDFSSDTVAAYWTKDNMGICPKNPLTVTSKECGKLELIITMRDSEKWKPFQTLFYTIIANPRPAIEILDREMTLAEIGYFNVLNELSVDDYLNFKNVEPLFDHPDTDMIARGAIKVT